MGEVIYISHYKQFKENLARIKAKQYNTMINARIHRLLHGCLVNACQPVLNTNLETVLMMVFKSKEGAMVLSINLEDASAQIIVESRFGSEKFSWGIPESDFFSTIDSFYNGELNSNDSI